MSERDTFTAFHGWGNSGVEDWALHVGYLPGRKSCCLYLRDGSVLRTLAFFRSEQDAIRALEAIDRLTGV